MELRQSFIVRPTERRSFSVEIFLDAYILVELLANGSLCYTFFLFSCRDFRIEFQ